MYCSTGRILYLTLWIHETDSFISLASKGSPVVNLEVCVSACTQKTPNLRCSFLRRRLTITPQRHRLADDQLSSLYPSSPSFSSFGAASVVLCCSAHPACSSTPLRPSAHYYPSISLVNVMCIQTFFDHLNVLFIFDQTGLYCFEVRPELYGVNVRLVVSPLSLTPPSSRWPALTTSPPLAKFQLVWHR